MVSTNTDDRLDDRSDDLLSQGSEIPADNTDPAHASDGLSERDGALGQAKAQLDAGQNPNEVKELCRESLLSVPGQLPTPPHPPTNQKLYSDISLKSSICSRFNQS